VPTPARGPIAVAAVAAAAVSQRSGRRDGHRLRRGAHHLRLDHRRRHDRPHRQRRPRAHWSGAGHRVQPAEQRHVAEQHGRDHRGPDVPLTATLFGRGFRIQHRQSALDSANDPHTCRETHR